MTDTQTGGGVGAPPAPEGEPDKALLTPAPSPLAAALVALQRDLPDIAKAETAIVKDQSGQEKYRYSYANLAKISKEIRPQLAEHGLAFVAWTQFSGDRFVLGYQLLHVSGAAIHGEYPLPTGGTPQALGSAITYGRRYALCAVTGLTPEDDDDDATTAARAAHEVDSETRSARDEVRGNWAAIFGPYDPGEARRYYATKFTRGGQLDKADARELRRFAAHLAAIPATEAGSDPNGTSSEAQIVGGSRKLTAAQNRMQQGLFAKVGILDAAGQRTFIGETLGAPGPIKRSEQTVTQAGQVIDRLTQMTSAGAEPVSGGVESGREGAPASAGPEAPADRTRQEGQ